MSSNPGGPEPASSATAHAALSALHAAISTARLYHNPKGQPGFIRAVEGLRETLKSNELVIIEVHKDGFHTGGGAVGSGNRAMMRLALAFYERGVVEIGVVGVPTEDELIAVADLLSADPYFIDQEGGPTAYMSGRHVSSIRLAERQLTVGTPQQAAAPGSGIPRLLRSLLWDQRGLAREVERVASPQEAYQQLQELTKDGLKLAFDRTTVHASVADTLASMSPSFRSRVVGEAMKSIDKGDDFANAVTGQLSDGELADALVELSDEMAEDQGLELVMSYAMQVVENSNGRRTELPSIVSKRLVERGADQDRIFHMFGTARILGQELADSGFVVSEDELEELRREAESLDSKSGFRAAISTMRAVLRTEGSEDDFDRLIDLAGYSTLRWLTEGPHDQALILLEMLIKESKEHPDPTKRARIEEALQSAVPTETLVDFLSEHGAADPVTRELMSVLRERMIPALLAQLAAEQDRGARKSLMDALAGLAATEIKEVAAALADPRWFVVRNIVDVLGRTHRPEIIPPLGKVASHPDVRVRREVARSISKGGPDAIPTLTRLLSDQDESVRLLALASLGSIPDQRATVRLASFLDAKPKPSVKERKEALRALALIGSPQALKVLRSNAATKWPPSNVTREVARHAAQLLDEASRRGAV